MIAIDTNILVYAHRRDSVFHKKAFHFLKNISESSEVWYLPWPCLHEFYAIVTNPRIYKDSATPIDAAVMQIQAWLNSPSCMKLAETDSYFDTLKVVLEKAKTVGAAVHDARIFALCMEHGVKQLFTCDRDFSRFSGIKVTNPL